MGCVLGTASRGGEDLRRSDKQTSRSLGKSDRRRSSDAGVRSEANIANASASAAPVATTKTEENHRSKSRTTGDFPAIERRRPRPDVFASNQDGWPPWLLAAAGDSIRGWTPRRASSFERLAKIGQGTYSNVYKARDLSNNKIVALKKVRFDSLEPESVKFMAREIIVLRKLDHPNVLKLEGLATSRMSCSLYLVFEYMEHDLAGLAARSGVKFTEAQIKCYMKQLLSGLEHCHENGVLHRDIKGSNLLINDEGILKIADFGLATFYGPDQKQQLTSRVVTLWYRPPELLLGATMYGVGIDLWSAGCILAELLAGKPIMPGRTEVEQLHKIFKLCGSPSEEYWKKYKLPNATLFKPQQPYKRCVTETFKDFPSCSVPLIESLLSIDPDGRGTATIALESQFFTTEPRPCDPSTLPKYPPSKELDVKLREEEARRQRGLSGKASANEGTKKTRVRDRAAGRAFPAPEANAEIQANLDRWRVATQSNAKSKSEKFPPPHQDGAVGDPQDASHRGPMSFGGGGSDASFGSAVFNPRSSGSVKSMVGPSSKKKKLGREDPRSAPSRRFIRGFKPSSVGISTNLFFKSK